MSFLSPLPGTMLYGLSRIIRGGAALCRHTAPARVQCERRYSVSTHWSVMGVNHLECPQWGRGIPSNVTAPPQQLVLECALCYRTTERCHIDTCNPFLSRYKFGYVCSYSDVSESRKRNSNKFLLKFICVHLSFPNKFQYLMMSSGDPHPFCDINNPA